VNDLLNAFGLGTGLVLYAMLLAMAVRDRRRGGRLDTVPLATAVLGIVWNLCSLSTYVLPRVGVSGSATRAAAVGGVIALGLLPAVMVHSVVRGQRAARWRVVALGLSAAAYTASAGAAAVQMHALWSGDAVPSVLGLQLLTWTFVALAVPLVVGTRRQPGGRRALWASALAAFAVSALHLSQFHEPGSTWLAELVGHHASIPLAVAILYQDYPFALADLFLKRALLLIALVATALFGLMIGSAVAAGSTLQFAVLAAGWVGTALAYPWLRAGINWFVDRVVLARPHYRSLEASVVRQLQLEDGVEPLLERVRREMGEALCATASRLSPAVRLPEDVVRPVVELSDGSSVRVTVPTAEPPTYVIEFSRLAGGRRILSDDVSFLSTVAVAAARRIDALRLTGERYERALREEEVAKLASQAELRALRAQLNPHFLFNALTTIGYLIQAAPTRAVDTLMRLTSLLRSVLRSEGEFTTLGREVDLVEAYLDIERARFESRLRVRIDVPAELRQATVPPLILQPIVENAVKHGIAPLRAGGEVAVSAREVGGPPRLVLCVSDTGSGIDGGDGAGWRRAGVGLTNVERRLQCHYGEASSLAFETVAGRGTVVTLTLPMPAADGAVSVHGRRTAS
jgi:signal transduction histidine kinase